jgi:hypothetical protein
MRPQARPKGCIACIAPASKSQSIGMWFLLVRPDRSSREAGIASDRGQGERRNQQCPGPHETENQAEDRHRYEKRQQRGAELHGSLSSPPRTPLKGCHAEVAVIEHGSEQRPTQPWRRIEKTRPPRLAESIEPLPMPTGHHPFRAPVSPLLSQVATQAVRSTSNRRPAASAASRTSCGGT